MKELFDQLLTPEQQAEWGRRLAAQRKPHTGRCQLCDRPIAGTVRKRYCSDYCRVKAGRQRQRAAEQRGSVKF